MQPWCVSPSAPTSPVRSTANTTCSLVQRYVLHQHVVAPLEKAVVHRKDRQHALLGHARRHSHGVALRDANIENRSGCAAAKPDSPVPSVMAAVMAQMRWSDAASAVNSSPNTEEKDGDGGADLPVAGSKGGTP